MVLTSTQIRHLYVGILDTHVLHRCMQGALFNATAVAAWGSLVVMGDTDGWLCVWLTATGGTTLMLTGWVIMCLACQSYCTAKLPIFFNFQGLLNLASQ